MKKIGNIIKINMYAERKNNSQLNVKLLEENILKYNSWLKKTDREDKIENYEKFLQA